MAVRFPSYLHRAKSNLNLRCYFKQFNVKSVFTIKKSNATQQLLKALPIGLIEQQRKLRWWKTPLMLHWRWNFTYWSHSMPPLHRLLPYGTIRAGPHHLRAAKASFHPARASIGSLATCSLHFCCTATSSPSHGVLRPFSTPVLGSSNVMSHLEPAAVNAGLRLLLVPCPRPGCAIKYYLTIIFCISGEKQRGREKGKERELQHLTVTACSGPGPALRSRAAEMLLTATREARRAPDTKTHWEPSMLSWNKTVQALCNTAKVAASV